MPDNHDPSVNMKCYEEWLMLCDDRMNTHAYQMMVNALPYSAITPYGRSLVSSYALRYR